MKNSNELFTEIYELCADQMDTGKYDSILLSISDLANKGKDLTKVVNGVNSKSHTALHKQNVTNRNSAIYDMNNIEIKAGHNIIYQKGQKYEATCDVVDRGGDLWFINWSDKNEDILVADFWHQPLDGVITLITNP